MSRPQLKAVSSATPAGEPQTIPEALMEAARRIAAMDPASVFIAYELRDTDGVADGSMAWESIPDSRALHRGIVSELAEHVLLDGKGLAE